jgi:hypothetical protein
MSWVWRGKRSSLWDSKLIKGTWVSINSPSLQDSKIQRMIMESRQVLNSAFPRFGFGSCCAGGIHHSEEIERLVAIALAEDIGAGDVTTLATVPENATAKAIMRARDPLVVSGLALAEAAFHQLSPDLKITPEARDGESVPNGHALMELAGPARPILTAERVALNFVQRLSGVATLTAHFVEAVRGTPARILDTRKTTPGWRRSRNTR